MANAEFTVTREFGTGLRDYLEQHGVRMDARATLPSNLDLFALFTVAAQPVTAPRLTLQAREAPSVGLLAA
jgi:hypothetical protein